MRILVYEYFSGGGFTSDSFSLSILCEGLGMLNTLISDFKTAGHHTSTIIDSRIIKFNLPPIKANQIIPISSFANLQDAIIGLSEVIAAAYIIAPETNGILQSILRIIEYAGIISLNCSISGIEKVSDKTFFNKSLKKINVNTPKTIGFSLSEKLSNVKIKISKNLCFPIVIKPSKGTSCEGISIVRNEKKLKNAITKIREETISKNFLAQEYIKGISVSVSLLSTENKVIFISLNKQNLILAEPDSNSIYEGGFVPYETHLKKQSFEIVKRIITAFPGLKGYVGFDLILTDNNVVVIEINPRLTTSYVGIRNVVKTNLAQELINCYFKKKMPSQIITYGYSFFSKIKVQISPDQPFISNTLSEDIISGLLQKSGFKTAWALISVKGKTKKETVKKFEEVKKNLHKHIKGGK